jgi:probable HAF family extracellular repeat protein
MGAPAPRAAGRRTSVVLLAAALILLLGAGAVLVTRSGLLSGGGGWQLTTIGGLSNDGSSQADAISAGGVVIGWSHMSAASDSPIHSWLWSKGRFSDLSPNVAHGSANGINSRGEVVGYPISNKDPNGFVYSGGRYAALPPLPGDSRSAPTAINDSGLVIGSSWTASTSHAAVWSGGKVSSLGSLPGARDSYASSVNRKGVAAGSSDVGPPDARGSTRQHAVIYKEGKVIDLGAYGLGQSTGRAINDAEQVVGSTQNAGGEMHAFLYASGKVTDLGTLGGRGSEAWAINGAGHVVGSYLVDSGSSSRAFLYRDGRMVNLNSYLPSGSGWTLVQAQAINDHDQIVGTGIDPTGRTRVWLLTPK